MTNTKYRIATSIIFCALLANPACELDLNEAEVGVDAGTDDLAEPEEVEHSAEAGVFVGAAASQQRSSAPPMGNVYLYRGKNYTDFIGAVTGTDWANMGPFTNTISSLRVGPNTRAILYKKTNFEEFYKSFDCDEPDLHQWGLGDNSGSLRTAPRLGWMWLFNVVGYGGQFWMHGGDVKKFPVDLQNKLASIKIGEKTNARLFSNSYYFGSIKLLLASDPALLSKIDTWRSVEIIPEQGSGWFYDYTKYGGKPLVADVGVSYLFDWDDRIESFKVGPNTTVKLFEHSWWGGWKYEKSQNVKYMPYDYRNKATSMWVGD